jgi:two-component system OmpR family response regulator
MYNVLVMCEEPDLKKLITSALSEDEFRVTSVSDISEAKAGKDKTLPDLAILNLEKRATNGWEICRELNQTLGIPVIVLGRDRSEDVWFKTVQAGADLYLTRPPGRQELVARIKAILRRYEKRK